MISWEGRILGRKNAPFHVQLELEKSAGVPKVLGEARVKSRAVRVFAPTADLPQETLSLLMSGSASRATNGRDRRTSISTSSRGPIAWRHI